MIIALSKEDQYRFKILWKLYTHRRWGASYTPIENVTRGLPGDEIGACRVVVEQLVREGILLFHKKRRCVSLNVRKKKEIVELLERIIL